MLRLALVPLAFSVIACAAAIGPAGTSVGNPALGVMNGTTLVVTLFVNGQPVATVPPRAAPPSIDVAALPAPPWTVEARSPTGRVLTSMQVAPGQIWSTFKSDGTASSQGAIGRVDLSCGSLRIWAGDIEPSGPAPVASPGTAGDCVP
jgi:hypothetical protein